MPTVPYYDNTGKRVPGVSTAKGNIGWGTDALVYWGKFTIGLESCVHVYKEMGGSSPDSFEKACREEIETRAKGAATAGTVAHYLIECDLKKTKPDTSQYPSDLVSLAETSFLNYLQWRESVHLEPVEIEPHLVHNELKYGGTPDVIANINGKLSIFDWKSGSVWGEHLIQLAAYEKLWVFKYPDKPLAGGFHLLKINKETAAFTHHWWQSLPEAWEMFLCALKLHDGQKVLKKMV